MIGRAKKIATAFAVLALMSLLFQNCSTELASQVADPESNPTGLSENSIQLEKAVIETSQASVEVNYTINGEVSAVKCQLNDEPAQPCRSTLDLSGAREGENALKVSVLFKDQTKIEKTIVIMKDTTPPDIQFLNAPASKIGLSEFDLRYDASDSGIGNIKVLCSRDGVDYSACTSPIRFSGMIHDQAYQIFLKVSDGLGNEKVVHRQWVIESAAVTILIERQPALFTQSTIAEFEFSGGATYTCELFKVNRANGTELSFLRQVNCTHIARLENLENGTYELKVTGRNNLQKSSESVNQRWTVDTQTPVMSWDKPIPLSVLESSLQISFSATDANGQLVSLAEGRFVCKLKRPDQDQVITTSACRSPFTVNHSAIGRYELTVSTFDRAGNSSTSAPLGWNFDIPDPVVVKPKISESDIFVQLNPNQSFNGKPIWGHCGKLGGEMLETLPSTGLFGNLYQSTEKTLVMGWTSDPLGQIGSVMKFFSQPDQEIHGNSPRCELSFRVMDNNNDTYSLPRKKLLWHGFKVFIPESWKVGSDSILITQYFHGITMGGLNPPLGLVVAGDELLLRLRSSHLPGIITKDSQIEYDPTFRLRTVNGKSVFGRWINIVFHMKLSPFKEDNPFLKVWIDGTLVGNHENPVGYAADKGAEVLVHGTYPLLGWKETPQRITGEKNRDFYLKKSIVVVDDKKIYDEKMILEHLNQN